MEKLLRQSTDVKAAGQQGGDNPPRESGVEYLYIHSSSSPIPHRAARNGDRDRGEGKPWVPTLTQVRAGGLGGNEGKGGAW